MSHPGLPRPERPRRLLVIVAHPGDAEPAIFGSVALWVADGAVAHLVCCTSGDAGADAATTDPLALAARREVEQREAAEIVGFEAVTFLHRPEGALANDLALREQLVRLIRAFRPDVVAAPDPRVLIHEDGLIHADGPVNHVDHREAGFAAIDAVSPAARNPMAFPHLVTSEGLQPHRTERLYLFGSDRPTAVVDVSAMLHVKTRAVRIHQGQVLLEPTPTDEPRPTDIQSTEAFRVIDLR